MSQLSQRYTATDGGLTHYKLELELLSIPKATVYLSLRNKDQQDALYFLNLFQ